MYKNMEYMIGQCYPKEFLRGMFNLTEEELNGRPFAKLGFGGLLRIQPCIYRDVVANIFDPFQMF